MRRQTWGALLSATLIGALALTPRSGGADGAPQAPPTADQDWSAVVEAAERAATYPFEAKLWDGRARRARTETWAKYALTRSESCGSMAAAAEEFVRAAWKEDVDRADQLLSVKLASAAEHNSRDLTNLEEELAVAATNVAAEYSKSQLDSLRELLRGILLRAVTAEPQRDKLVEALGVTFKARARR